MARQHARKSWAALKAAYRRGEGSIAELAPKFGIPASTAEKRCAREKWQVQRQEVGNRAEAKATERDVETLAAMLAKHRRVASRMLALALEELEKEATKSKRSANRIDALSRVATRAIPVERLAAGIERVKPVKPVELTDDDEIVFEVDAPQDEEAPAAPAKAS